MHWADQIAAQLMKDNPEKDTFVCASGISPSGSVHIGNFREAVTTYFVTKALEKAGRKARFLFSWDDFDRFRKVPVGVDPSFEQYLGLPLTEVPCPGGCHVSYAAHYEQQFETALAAFGIYPEFRYQSKEYQSRRYNGEIQQALQRRGEIYDIMEAFKTGEASDEHKSRFYPVNVYCEVCGKDSTTVESFDAGSATLSYRCLCGCSNLLSVAHAVNLKLHWKVDWPMRWAAEEVDFEPGGRDHSSETGSYAVSSIVAENMFGRAAPLYAPYEFIGIKGSYAKMSSSSGHNYTPDDLLQIYAPENLLFLFAKYRPEAAFDIGLDEDVIRNCTEYERYRQGYFKGTLEGDLRSAMELALGEDAGGPRPRFSMVAGVLPLTGYDLGLLRTTLAKQGEDFEARDLEGVCARAEHWIRNWQPERDVELNRTPNVAVYSEMTEEERGWVQDFRQLLTENEAGESGSGGEHWMGQVYAICRHEDHSISKRRQKRLFTLLYLLILGRSEGPRLPLLIEAAGAGAVSRLLEFTPDA